MIKMDLKNQSNIRICVFHRSIPGARDETIFNEIGYNVIVYSLPDFLSSPIKSFKCLFRPLQWSKWYKKLKCVDVFFAWWAISFDVVLLSKIMGKPCIIVAGGGEIETSKDLSKEYSYAYANSHILKKWMTKLTLKFADKVISVSNYTKENADKIAKNPTNEVVYNSIDTEKFKPVKVEKKPYILTTVAFMINSVTNTKGILPLFEAFTKITIKHPEYRLVYLGNSYEGTGAKGIIKKRAKELGILDKVIFMDFFKTGEEYAYANFLNQCKIYVQYSWNETFGVAMCEAMVCGVPVVASNRTALPEVVGNAGLIADRGEMEKGNPDDLAEKIEMLINDENLYNKLSKKGVERVRNNFSKEIRKQKLKRIIKEMVSKSRK